MERFFVSVALIYTLASCGLLLVAFFNSNKQPNRYLLIGFWTICMHVVYKLMWIAFANGNQYEPPVPFGLFYPVLLYLHAHVYYRPDKVIPKRIEAVVVLPFLTHLVLLITATQQVAGGDWTIWYSKVYYASSMLSLLVYAVLTTRLYNTHEGSSTSMDMLIRQLTMLCYGLVVFTYLTWYEMSMPKSEIGFSVRSMVFLFLIIGVALIVRYSVVHKVNLLHHDYQKNGDHTEADRLAIDHDELEDVVPKLPEPLVQHLVEIIERELNYTKLFLNPSISLDMLAEYTCIPRRQLTQVFNRHYKKSFYQFIATARIEYAIGRISEMGETITLDSLSYECGFNSKTSFNKYFKEYTGMTPSEFRSTSTPNHVLYLP